MKKYSLLFALIFMLLACSRKKKPDAITLADAVCDCKMKTKGMKYKDPERIRIWKECLDLQGGNWKKIMGNKPWEEAYNKRLKECMLELTIGK